MKPAPFEYHAPDSAKEAVDLLAELGDGAKLIAGGQSLVPVLAMRLAVFDHLIDIRRITALRGIEERGDSVWIGAATTEAEIGRSALIARRLPLLSRATPLIGHFQIRNRGTIGGSLAHADAAAEYPAVALALDATSRRCRPAASGRSRRPSSSPASGPPRLSPTSCSPGSASRRRPGGRASRSRSSPGARATSRWRARPSRSGLTLAAGSARAASACSGSARPRCAPRPPRRRSPASPRAISIRRRSGGPPWRTWTRSRPTCTAPPATGRRWARPWSPAPGTGRQGGSQWLTSASRSPSTGGPGGRPSSRG